ncbi:S8 family serine peptidase [Blastococcus saxobsidens]|uniref:Peptidase S8/S53 domain-containing protein n=1 Tax=Blastococcus saxobsidens (strain DD2) TaxID=1146883 RepID=H6RVY6_BLASD|nr:S8 family serine peptidase [Blastococcus saxobsidens]CCG05816.1 protein of unknown function [Blastococcus saxobsidens DD2]
MTPGCGFFGPAICGTYHQTYGISMAAPLVAGVAALARSANPELSAADIGSCIVSTAGRRTGTVAERGTVPGTGNAVLDFPVVGAPSLPIVDAEAAVKCAQGGLDGGGILVLGAGDRTGSGDGSDLGDLTQRLTEEGYEVSTSQTMPADLSGFDQVWHIDTQPLTGSEVDRLAAFVESGRSVYLTGEWGCCPIDQSTIGLINRLTGGNVGHGGENGTNTVPVNSDAIGNIDGTDTPNQVSTLQVATSGSLRGVPARSIVAAVPGDPTRAVWAAWDSSQVTGGGKVVALMDINWFAHQYRGDTWDEVTANIAKFLS